MSNLSNDDINDDILNEIFSFIFDLKRNCYVIKIKNLLFLINIFIKAQDLNDDNPFIYHLEKADNF